MEHVNTIAIVGGGFAGTTLGRKVRIFVEWKLGMFFPTDITHLRFTRSHDVDEAGEREAPSVSAPATWPVELRVA